VCPENGDIVTGASDRIVRIFTRATERYADEAAIAQFYEQVKASSIPQQALDGGINKEKLPGPEFLTQKSGTKEGQVQMINESNGNISAYQWSTGSSQWINVGTVVDNVGSSGRKISHNGKEYDYVFDVDIEEGKPPLKLPYNLSQNSFEVARKFCEDNKLPITYVDQVANFIVQNTQGATLGQTTQAPQPESTGASWGNVSAPPPPAPKPKLLPQKDYLDILTANHKVIFKKLQEFNQQLVDDGNKGLSMNPADVEHLNQTILAMEKGNTKSIDSSGIDLIVKSATAWPVEKRLPGLDLLRLLFASSESITYLAQNMILQELTQSGVFEPTSPTNNTMMAVRALSNLFKTQAGRDLAKEEFDSIHESVRPFITSPNRNLIIAVTTLYINYSVLLSSELNADRALTLLDDLSKILGKATDSEAVYRGLVAAGTLLYLGDAFCEASRDIFGMGAAVKNSEEKVREPRVKNVVAEIKEKLK
jgi:phospholipase A-2-activating protein